ncbi:A/G-specific adenine glycosylase [Sandaracinobacter neustonicus]|uniref:Adenine DNA glycosylase n=1 Tax=Sandaracinobacter neustonicus TaxID=1715348 RepID=A0A501XLD8_9SPHN|nr:NUDIX domain-containing protein [Sandaracinobacter neustonicus]TPE61113.1 A/G-specific adenine glycosylase [Sandaracinobacter neustonicus]
MAANQQIDAAASPTRKLLSWYDAHARALPWRAPPGSNALPDPYRVWLSEIMLQQTTVAAVGPYFERFLALWPDVQALAAADDADVMREWAGLGYYARARNLLAAARAVAARGGFPASESGLRELPGVGPYTAAAIAAIAFNEPAVVIDGNIERVASRLFALPDALPAGRARLAAALAPLVPPDRPGDFAQALMDLGATICTPRSPRCLLCPLNGNCLAHATGQQEAFPVKPPRKARPLKRGTLWWIEHAGEVALVRRPPRGLLGGMLALPGTAWSVEGDMSLPFPADWQLLETPVRHGFTHFELELRVAAAHLPHRIAHIAGHDPLWTPRNSLAGLPTLFARAAALALAHLPELESA